MKNRFDIKQLSYICYFKSLPESLPVIFYKIRVLQKWYLMILLNKDYCQLEASKIYVHL